MGDVVGSTNIDQCWIWRLHLYNCTGQTNRRSLWCVWGPGDGSPHSYRGGQLRRLLQRTEKTRGQRTEKRSSDHRRQMGDKESPVGKGAASRVHQDIHKGLAWCYLWQGLS